MQASRTFLLLILLVTASFPILYGIMEYAVNIPFHDEWGSIWLLRKSFRGNLTLENLLKPQNSYRQLVPNLLFIALGYTAKLNLKWEMLLTFAMVVHTGWMWVGFLRRVGVIPFLAVAGVSFFFFSTLFTASQYENWVLGMQFVYFLPVYCLTLCIRVASSDMRIFLRSAIVILISFLCTLSSANGFLCWLSLLPLAWAADIPRNSRKTWPWLGLCLSIGLLSCGAYLFDFEKTGQRIDFREQWPSAETFSAFLIRLAGNGFGIRPDILLADIFGWMTLIGWLTCCVIVIRLRRDRESIGMLLPWFVLGLYGLGNAILITLGRSHFGLEQAFAPRYTGFTLFLCLSVTIMPVIARFQRPDVAWLRTVAWVMTAWMVTATVLKWARHRDDFERMRHFTSEIALGKAGLLVSRQIPFTEQETSLFLPRNSENLGRMMPTFVNLTSWLDSNQMIHPRLFAEPYLSASNLAGPPATGVFSGAAAIGDSVSAKGRFTYGEPMPLREAVVITSRDGSGRRRFVGIDNSGSPEWNAVFPKSRLNEADSLLEAWMLDGETGRFRSIPGSHAIPN